MRRLAQDFQAGRVLRRHIRAVLVAKREPQGHDVWPRRLARDGAPDVVFPTCKSSGQRSSGGASLDLNTVPMRGVASL